ncbi:helix-turn-helix domain-containing protein [Tundrisphaera sp. TA3]|uniref:helix-turn-helix domain-containing protein n=1 Tax=Tundrisphaera sp. TA3 TaxID=3435775 RepID=UPI003EBF7BE6
MTSETRTPYTDRYLDLQSEVPLRPLRSEGDLDRAIRMVDSLVDREDHDRDQSDYLAVLTRLIEGYEAEEHPIPAATDAELLRHLIDAKG